MAETGAYYSTATPGVYHNCTNCNVGKNIDAENKKYGTDGRTLCAECARLRREGGC